MPKTVEFIFDFGAPNGYLAWYPLKDIAERTGTEILITPIFLGGLHKLTGNAPPMVRDADVKGKVAYAALEFQRFIDKHGMSRFRVHPDLPFNTIILQRALVAVGAGERSAMLDALLPAVWERNIDCSDPDVIAAELSAAGFDAGALIASTQNPSVKQELADNTQSAADRGAFGVPTFFIGREMWFGKERLGQIEEALSAS